MPIGILNTLLFEVCLIYLLAKAVSIDYFGYNIS